MPSQIGLKRRLVSGLVFALAAQWLSSPAAARPRPDRSKGYEASVNLGKILLDEGKDAEAATAFQKALTFQSDDDRAEVALARISEERGNWEKAAEFYERARRKAPSNYLLCTQLARAYAAMGRLDLAKKTYAQAKSIDPKQADAYIEEGYEHLASGEEAQAKEQFQSLIDIDTASPYGYHHMGSYFLERGDLVEAERSMRRTLELLRARSTAHAPKHLDAVLHAMFDLSFILDKQDRMDEEESLLRQALSKSNPLPQRRVQVLDRLAHVYDRQGKQAQAEKTLRKAMAVCRPAAACAQLPRRLRSVPLIHLAVLYADEGRTARAQDAADEAWGMYPPAERMQEDDFHIADQVRKLYVRLGDDAKAERIERLTISQRHRLLPMMYLGYAEARMAYHDRTAGRYAEASELYRDAIRIARLHGESPLMVQLELGLARTWILARLKRDIGHAA